MRPDTCQHPTTRHSDPEDFSCAEAGVHTCRKLFFLDESNDWDNEVGLPCQRIELLRWTQFARRAQLALSDHVHEFDTGKGRRS